jgi:hypothetical protein
LKIFSINKIVYLESVYPIDFIAFYKYFCPNPADPEKFGKSKTYPIFNRAYLNSVNVGSIAP